MSFPKIPQNWTVRGDIPEVEPATAAEDRLELLDEDLAQIVDATGTYALDVGWYPAASRTGRFLCRAVYQEDWDCPLEELETGSRPRVLRWIEGWISEIQSRIGQQGTFSDELVTTFFLPSVSLAFDLGPELAAYRGPVTLPGVTATPSPITATGSASGIYLGTRVSEAHAAR